MAYRIVTDGSCDLPVEFWSKMDLTVVPFYVSFDSINYQREIVDIPIREFYDKMVADSKTFPKSSMPSVQDYIDAFTPLIQKGFDIICICITSKFSGSLQSAINARNMLLEEYPDANISVIDSTIDTVLQGIYVLEAVKMQQKNVSFEDAVAELEAIKDTGRIFFTIGNLDYLRHGGRIGKLSGITGNLLGIRPIITLKEGEIHNSGISRGRNKSLEKVKDLLLQYLNDKDKNLDDYSLCIGYGYDIEEAKSFRDETIAFLASHGYQLDDIPMYQIGATIAVHTGPYPLGLGIVKKNKFTR